MTSDTDSPRLLAFIAELRRKLRPIESACIPFNELSITLTEKDGSIKSDVTLRGGGHTPVAKS